MLLKSLGLIHHGLFCFGFTRPLNLSPLFLGLFDLYPLALGPILFGFIRPLIHPCVVLV